LERASPPFLVVEYVDGVSLEDELARRREPFSPAEVLLVFEGLAAALDHAHSRRVLHRQVSPAHVYLERAEGRIASARLADFGIGGEEGDPRGDVHGLAVTIAGMNPALAALLHGEVQDRPASAGALLEQFRRALAEPPRPPDASRMTGTFRVL